jgi:hypothetical protein
MAEPPMAKRWGVSLWLLCAVAALGCEPGDSLEGRGTPVAWVDGEAIVIEQLRGRDAGQTAEQRRELVDRAIGDLLAAREARRRGLGFSEDVVGRLVAIRRAAEQQERVVLRQALRKTVTWGVEVSDREARDYYEARRELFEQRWVGLRVVRFATEAAARSASANPGAEHRDAVASREVDSTPSRGLPEPLRAAVRELDEVGASTVIAGGAGWSLVVLRDERREAVAFSDVREKVLERVRRRRERERFDAEIERLRAGADIRVEQAVVEADAVWSRRR